MALEGIECLSRFIDELGIPRHLKEVGFTEEMVPLVAQSCNKIGGYHKPTVEEVEAILRDCM